MRQTLKPHPDTPCDAISRVAVGIARPHPRALVLTYLVTGVIDDVRLPPAAAALARTDGLWQHTCFEAFIRPSTAPAYHEFNFAPSTQWAAYRFTGYREGMTTADKMAPPRIETHATQGTYTLTATLELHLPAPPWNLGFSAIIEETSGRKSYWALAHPPGKPDFHHAIAFAYELKAPHP